MIVEGVYRYYTRRVKKKLSIDGTAESGPEWTKETIVNHLMFSSNPVWSRVFGTACTMMLRGLVLKANHATIDSETSMIIPEAAEALCKFIDRHDKHVKEQLLIAELIAKSKNRRSVNSANKSSSVH